MMNFTGPGSGISPLSATWSTLGAMRNVPAELRAAQKANGHSTLGDTGTISARPVAQVLAADKARGGALDPLLTGPRPTFDKTPLEKMRADAMPGSPDRVEPVAAGQEERVQPTSGTPEHPRAHGPVAAYTGLRDIEASNTQVTTLDKTT